MPFTLTPSNSDTTIFKVAAVQAEPIWLDLQGSVDKTISIVREAAANGAKIIGFPEVFIPGYPWTPWANNFAVTATVLKEYQANALALHSPEMDRIREAVKEADITAVVGFAERDGGSLYIAQATILPNGTIANHRRKIKPTHYEKTIFGDGSAQSIYNVVQTPFGRVGSLNCWEHIQPWFKTHFYSQHPQIFVGAWWPAFAPGAGGSPYIVSGEASSRMTQMVSMEGGCFGLACCHVVSEEGAKKMKILGFPWFEFPGGGFTTIYGPDGSILAKAANSGTEEIVYANISLSQIDEVKMVADIMGNYSRFDLFHTVVHGKNWDAIEYTAEEASAARERAAAVDNINSVSIA
ncbi:Cyanide hydratase [Mycena indigotica]|uniref:Cyanide hydratase n=1 Tax=Mycena indigotica TaxID=2126181 RepID=A0A8H6SWY4_9AGAR|nr:Cyanide hydratase [Mycena indigotica]KAF7306803.1 Cyanide hydratase [Mycena indigotica]